jgi:site-specific DNA-methyltransferase (adenine-specific)
MLDGQTGTCRSAGDYRHGPIDATGYGGWHTDGGASFADSGGASRFFYCAKASRSERESGLFTMSECETIRYSEKAQGPLPQQTPSKPVRQSNTHPTVKPLALMRWLVRLVAYPGDTVLDPFAGSGTTGVACAMEGREFIGIEREAEYIEIARRRIEAASAQERLPV